jgi:CBS domain-containing protein
LIHTQSTEAKLMSTEQEDSASGLPVDFSGSGGWRPSRPVEVRDLMTTRPVTVGPAATVRDIARVLLEHDVSCVPVVDVGEQLVGVVSEADLVCREGYPTVRSHHLAAMIDEAVAEHRHHWTARAEGLTAQEIMTSEVVTCAPSETIGTVVRRMLRHGIRVLPVVEAGQVVGVLSRHDILGLFDRPDTEIKASVTELLADPLWAPDSHAVEVEVRDGVVILTGSVRHPSHKRLVRNLVGEVPGVVEVADRLTWESPDPEPGPRSSDQATAPLAASLSQLVEPPPPSGTQ